MLVLVQAIVIKFLTNLIIRHNHYLNSDLVLLITHSKFTFNKRRKMKCMNPPRKKILLQKKYDKCKYVIESKTKYKIQDYFI